MRDSDPELSAYQEQLLAELGQQQTGKEVPEGFSVKPLYTARDTQGLSFAESLPGAPPFVRGARASMYLGRPWTLRQYAGFSTAEETNAFYRAALAGGQKGLSVAFDLATHRGYDSDHPRVSGDVGMAGVAVDSVEDMSRLFHGIDLAQVSVSMTMNGAVLPVLAAFIVAAEEQGVSAKRLRGTIQNDILKEFMVRNTYIYPPGPSMRIVADVIEYAASQMPQFNSVSISGYHMHEAGATADLELAYTLADGLDYVRAAASRGLSVDAFAPRLSFFFAIGMRLFIEVAKLRAARLLWSQLMTEHFAPQDARSKMLRMHCQTSGVSLTRQDPLNNVVRTAVEGLAAVLGGTQSLHTNAYDEALALPSDTSSRVARNTQLILRHEVGLCDVADPLGGSYLLESLTSQLASRARYLIEEVEGLGGMTRAVEDGLPKRRIEAAAAQRAARLDQGLDVIVGVNAYRPDAEDPIGLRVIDNGAVRATQVQRLAELKRSRDDAAVRASLSALRQGAEANANLLQLSMDAARVRATVGEISAALEDVFGRYSGTASVVTGVYGAAFSADTDWAELIARVDRLAEQLGRRPRVLVAKLGQDGHDRGARLVASGLADLGFDVDLGPLFLTPQEVARQALDNDVHVVGISTQAGAHRTLVPQLLEELAREGASGVHVVCGGIVPDNDAQALREAGAAAIFGPGTPLADAARQIIALLEAN